VKGSGYKGQARKKRNRYRTKSMMTMFFRAILSLN